MKVKQKIATCGNCDKLHKSIPNWYNVVNTSSGVKSKRSNTRIWYCSNMFWNFNPNNMKACEDHVFKKTESNNSDRK